MKKIILCLLMTSTILLSCKKEDNDLIIPTVKHTKYLVEAKCWFTYNDSSKYCEDISREYDNAFSADSIISICDESIKEWVEHDTDRQLDSAYVKKNGITIVHYKKL